MTRRDTFKLSLSAAGQPLVLAETPRGPRQYKWIPKLSENLPDCQISTLKWLKQLGCTYVIFQGTDDVDTSSSKRVLRKRSTCSVTLGSGQNGLFAEAGP